MTLFYAFPLWVESNVWLCHTYVMVTPSFGLKPSLEGEKLLRFCFENYPTKNQESECVYVELRIDGTLLSIGRMEKENPETYCITHIAVRPELRKKKIGSYTVKFLCNRILSLGGRYATASIHPSFLPFFTSLGFRVDQDGEIHLDNGTPSVHLKKSLIRKRSKNKSGH